MVQMTVKNVLFECDGPLVLEAKDEKLRTYVCLNTVEVDKGSKYLVTYVKNDYLYDFLNQDVDLRFLITKGARGVYRWAILYGEPGEAFDAKPYKEAVNELLPAAGFFLPVPKSTLPSNREIRSIVIDGKWGIGDLKQFPGLIQDVYAFAYSLKSDKPAIRSRLKSLYEKYPWRGGFSTINFFNDIYGAIPRKEEARISSIKYASEGELRVEVNKDIAQYLGVIINEMISSDEIHDSYREVHKNLKEKKWLGRSARDFQLSPGQEKYLKGVIVDFAKKLGLSDRVDHITFLAKDDPLATIKILLSFYRKMARLDLYIRTGKARDVFMS